MSEKIGKEEGSVTPRKFRQVDYSEEELLKGIVNNQWKMLMNFQLTRAKEWFQKSEDGINGFLRMQDGQFGHLYAYIEEY